MVSMTPALIDLLQELRSRPRKRAVDTVLITSEGNSWSPGGLGKRVGEAATAYVRERGL